MTDRWFRLPKTTDEETGTTKPDFKGHEDAIDGWSGNKPHPDGSPSWVVRMYADQSTLDALADESQVVALDGVPTQALNQMFGQNRSSSEWNESFKVGDV